MSIHKADSIISHVRGGSSTRPYYSVGAIEFEFFTANDRNRGKVNIALRAPVVEVGGAWQTLEISEVKDLHTALTYYMKEMEDVYREV